MPGSGSAIWSWNGDAIPCPMALSSRRIALTPVLPVPLSPSPSRPPFATTPVVVTTITSVNEDESVVSRLCNITPTGFQFRLQEQEANPQVHATETVTYLAWEPSVGVIGNLQFEVRRIPDVVKHLFQRIDFTAAFADSPVLVAEMQTADGLDTANLRRQAKTSSGVEVRVAEEQSKDSETNHTTEVVGYLVLSLEN